MFGKNLHVDCSLAHYLRNAFGRVIKLQINRLVLWVVEFDLLGSLPTLTGLAPHQLVKFVDGGPYTYF